MAEVLWGELTGNNGQIDVWIIKLDSIGGIEWQKNFGGSNIERSYSMDTTADGGYIFVAETHSNDGDLDSNNGNNYDCWIVKLNNVGNIVWQRSIGGTGDDFASSVRSTLDGGYIVAGGSESNDGDVSGNHGYSDFWIIKLDSLGDISWQNTLTWLTKASI